MHDSPASDAPKALSRRLKLAALATAAGIALLASLSLILTRSPLAPAAVATGTQAPPAEVAQAPAQEASASEAPVGDTADGLSFPAPGPLRSALNQPEAADAAPATPFARQDPLPQQTAEAAPQTIPQTVPLPVRRPSEFRAPDAQAATRRAERAASRRTRTATVAPAQSEDERNFFEKFFGIERKPAPALAYAALETNGAIEALPRRPLTPVPTPPPAASGSGVAVYDISAKTVTLPNGEKLEAHSGLGAYMDDPRYVHEKMRGATPPGTYDLTEREALFHGVRAIRLTPVGGPGAIFNRAGLLAHTFMLGPQGASNGCISFRNYGRFLQAFLNGEIQRVVVVAGSRGQDPISSIFASR